MYNFEEIVLKGKFYFPANLHYINNVSVKCDRCQKTDITSCIGYNKMDLCLKCADIVSDNIRSQNTTNLNNEIYESEYKTFMEQSIYSSYSDNSTNYNDIQLRMRQNIFNSDIDNGIKTLMRQNMFNIEDTRSDKYRFNVKPKIKQNIINAEYTNSEEYRFDNKTLMEQNMYNHSKFLGK
jgi:hypothetical protein